MSAQNNSQQITQQSQSNFTSSFWFLPKEKRAALNAVYAYCRITDDIVDLAPNAEQAKFDLDIWRVQLKNALENFSGHPILVELAQAAEKYRIHPKYFFELADGMEMDLHKKTYASFDELEHYCYLAAGTVGLMCMSVFESHDPRSGQYAKDLGTAFQLTNILRDLRSDSSRSRVYLPQEDLQKFHLSSEDFFNIENLHQKKSQFCDLMLFECERAESFYAKARANLVPVDRPNLLAAEIMTAVYHAILKKVKKNPLSVLDKKISLSKPEVFFRLAQGWLCNKFPGTNT